MELERPAYLTTREVADLIRVKERKVYDLAAAGEIPHRRITGKLLFPAGEIEAWINGSTEGAGSDRPAVISGSHDPLLDWAVREADCGLATLFNGSQSGLDAYAAGTAAAAGLHLPQEDGWNTGAVTERGLRGCVLISWARRRRGFIVAQELAGKVGTIADLKGKTLALRQQGAGSAALLDRLCKAAGLDGSAFDTASGIARTENDAAAAVAAGDADAALGIEAMARQFHLAFVPVVEEQFDLLIDRKSYFTQPFQDLLSLGRSGSFRNKADGMGGYDISELGKVRWLSP